MSSKGAHKKWMVRAKYRARITLARTQFLSLSLSHTHLRLVYTQVIHKSKRIHRIHSQTYTLADDKHYLCRERLLLLLMLVHQTYRASSESKLSKVHSTISSP